MTAARTARTVSAAAGSTPARNASGVSWRRDETDPRTYMTRAFAWAWLNPWFSRRNATCSAYFASPSSFTASIHRLIGPPCFFSMAGKCCDLSPLFPAIGRG